MLVHVVRWFFLLGFIFLVFVGVWAVIMVTRIKREQAVAIGTLDALAAKAGIQREGDHLVGSTPAAARDVKLG